MATLRPKNIDDEDALNALSEFTKLLQEFEFDGAQHALDEFCQRHNKPIHYQV